MYTSYVTETSWNLHSDSDKNERCKQGETLQTDNKTKGLNVFYIREFFCFLIKQVVIDIIPKQNFTSTDKTDEENMAIRFIKYIFSFYC